MTNDWGGDALHAWVHESCNVHRQAPEAGQGLAPQQLLETLGSQLPAHSTARCTVPSRQRSTLHHAKQPATGLLRSTRAAQSCLLACPPGWWQRAIW